MELKRGHYCLVGGSGAGKSTFGFSLARSWLKQSEDLKKIFVLNVKSKENDVPPDTHFLDWSNFATGASPKDGSLEQSIILIEDIIQMPACNKNLIREVLNYCSRRSSIYLIAIVHSLHGTCMMNCVQYFDYICFFGSGLNIGKSFNILKTGGGLSSQLKASGGNTLALNCGKHGRYNPVMLDLEQQELQLLDNQGRVKKVLLSSKASTEEGSICPLAEFKAGIDLFLASAETERKLGHFILRNVPQLIRKCGRPKDLTLAFRNRSGNPRRVSILDFCQACVTPSGKPASGVRALFKFLSGHMELPRLLVKNKYLIKARKAKRETIKASEKAE